MRKEYVKPEIAVEEILLGTMFAASNITDEDVDPFSNDRDEGRSWGDLWN